MKSYILYYKTNFSLKEHSTYLGNNNYKYLVKMKISWNVDFGGSNTCTLRIGNIIFDKKFSTTDKCRNSNIWPPKICS